MIKVEQLPNVVNSADQFHDYLHRIFDMYKADDLKTLEARSKTTGQDIVYQQAVKNMIQFAETLNDSGVGGCFAIVEINGNTIITDDEPFVAWNQGRGRLHTEHRLLPLLLDNLRDYGNPGELCEIWCDVIIRYSPCADSCENIQFSVQDRVNLDYPGVRIRWQFVKLFQKGAHTLKIARGWFSGIYKEDC